MKNLIADFQFPSNMSIEAPFYHFNLDEDNKQLQFIGLELENSNCYLSTHQQEYRSYEAINSLLEFFTPPSEIKEFNDTLPAQIYYSNLVSFFLEDHFKFNISEVIGLKNIIKKFISKKKQSNCQKIKNCARYLIQAIIRKLPLYSEQIKQICQVVGLDHIHFIKHFENNFKKFSSIDAIREYWMIEEQQTIKLTLLEKYKLIFKYFCKLFLLYKANRHVLLGKMANKKYYLKTIRQMLFYINQPEHYRSNIY